MALTASDGRAALSVCIITRNEERNLPRCLESVAGLASQIVVVDSLSDDATCEIAAAAGAEVVKQEFLGHVKQKQLALERATGDWILCLDADEWLDGELRDAVKEVLTAETDDSVNGYKVNRWPFYLGKWINHGGWSPDWKLRLVRHGRAYWTGYDPHDRLEVTGRSGRLRGRLCHFPHENLFTQVRKINDYSSIVVESRGPVRRVRALFGIFVEPPLVFLKEYVLQRGFLDGLRGFIAASMMSFYSFLKYAKQWEKSQGQESPKVIQRS